MANPNQNHLVGTDAEYVRRWRTEHPESQIDLSGMDLTGQSFERWDASNASFAGSILKAAVFKAAILKNADFSGADLEGADLSLADLRGANFHGARLWNARLEKVHAAETKFTDTQCNNASFNAAQFSNVIFDNTNLSGANFNSASIQNVDLKTATVLNASFQNVDLHGFDFSDFDLTNAKFVQANLAAANFTNTILNHGDLRDANLTDAILDHARLEEASLEHANLTRVSFSNASLRHCNLSRADCSSAEFRQADCFEMSIGQANLYGAQGLPSARNLTTVLIKEVSEHDVRNFDKIGLSPMDRLVGWEQIRWVGRLPLFGASYTALIAIPFLYFLLDFYNRKVDVALLWAATEIQREGGASLFAKFLLAHMHKEPIPTLSELLLISTVLLGIGATTFAIFCPARIREFSKDQWRDELGRSVIHYAPFSWRLRFLRILCVVCYAVGGAGVVAVLASKLWNVFFCLLLPIASALLGSSWRIRCKGRPFGRPLKSWMAGSSPAMTS